MKINRIKDNMCIHFDPSELDRLSLSIGAGVLDRTLWALQAEYLRLYPGEAKTLIPGYWYYIEPTKIGSVLNPGLYKVVKVDTVNPYAVCFYIDGESDRMPHEMSFYKLTHIPLANIIESWKNSSGTKTTPVFPQANHWYHIRPIKTTLSVLKEGDYFVTKVGDRCFWIIDEPASRFHSTDCYSFEPLTVVPTVERVILKAKFVPAAYSEPTATWDCYRKVFPLNTNGFDPKFDPKVGSNDPRCSVVLQYMKEHGFGEYFFSTGVISSTGEYKIERKWSVFHIPAGGDPKDWFPTDTGKWRVCSYRRVINERDIAWYITDGTNFLWRDGTVVNESTGFNRTTMACLAEAPGYFKSKDTARKFLATWINQGKTQYKDWVIHTYDCDVYCLGGVHIRGEVKAFDLYDAASTIVENYRGCFAIHFEENLPKIKIGMDKFDG